MFGHARDESELESSSFLQSLERAIESFQREKDRLTEVANLSDSGALEFLNLLCEDLERQLKQLENYGKKYSSTLKKIDESAIEKAKQNWNKKNRR